MFPLAANSLTQTRAYSRFGRRSRRAAASALAAGAAIAILASASNFANAAESSASIAQEQHACAVVMGLHRPGDLYDTCIRSLDKSLAELDQSRLAWTDRSACAQEGLRPGTPAYAVCVVNAEQTPTDAASYREGVAVH
jgi:hypothetical protein